jgi:hypothetical protein
MKIAVVFNPNAGGINSYYNIGKILEQRLKEYSIKTYEGAYGQVYLRDAEVISGAVNTGDYIKNIHSMIMKVIEAGPELLICIGGDGFAAYIADAMIRNKINIPLMGIAGGTANVGPIVNIKPEKLDTLDLDKVKLSHIGAIEVSLDSSIIGYAFNDVIIGDTFLGTIDGQMQNIAIEPFLANNIKKQVKPSEDIVSDSFKITKNGLPIEYIMKKPAQIVISPIDGLNLYGKAVAGALCIAPFQNCRGALALIDSVIVSMTLDYRENGTITTEHVIFDEQDLLNISGLSGKGHIVIDGNPFIRFNSEDVNIRYISNAVTVADA